ncbi:DUF2312 domain-containing protein [Neorhizobium sp. AL 9.2.2]|uniref:DUF2312 domain-containing protein n=1 Tax=Neorhizobium sp. AL 9.2.2 TaxID=2712894 RepID=UPI0015740276|nr:DUF2312 domain-containing protein [Neorhizobium sp. AL 9.2.2]
MTADKQLKAYIDRVLRLKAEQDTIGDDIREVYAEAKGEGYDKTVMGKIVAHLRKVEKSGADAVDEAETIFETYLSAYHRASGTVVATHTHEENFDRDTGEVLDINPRLAKQVVDGMQTEAGRAALIAAVDIMIEQEEAEEQEFPTNPEEVAEAKGAAIDDAEDRGEGDTDRQRSPEPGTTGGGKQGAREQVDSSPVPDRNSEIAPASHGEAEAPSIESEPPATVPALHRPDANTGGDHVTASENAQPDQDGPGLVSTPRPSKHPILLLRPHCQHPGEEVCGGSGKNHCQKCLAAMRELETA